MCSNNEGRPAPDAFIRNLKQPMPLAEKLRLADFAITQFFFDLWRDQEQREEYERYFASLLKKYVVVMDEDLKPLVGPLDSSIAGPVGGSPEEGTR